MYILQERSKENRIFTYGIVNKELTFLSYSIQKIQCSSKLLCNKTSDQIISDLLLISLRSTSDLLSPCFTDAMSSCQTACQFFDNLQKDLVRRRVLKAKVAQLSLIANSIAVTQVISVSDALRAFSGCRAVSVV